MPFTIADIAGLVTVVIGLYLAASTRNKARAESDLAISQAAKNIVELREKDFDRLEARYKLLTNYVQYLLDTIEALVTTLEKNGIQPDVKLKALDDFQSEA